MKKKSSLYKIFLFIIITILLISTAYYLYNQKITVLKIIDYKENKTIWSSEVKEDEQFTIKYLHSVARTPVLEIFAIRSGDIVLTSTEYQSYGAGLPFLDQHEYLLEDDKFI